jgi:hypothetical protein
MELRDLCFQLRSRRRMYVLDDRFSTVVAFVCGYDAALDGVPLRGFQDHVAKAVLGQQSNLHWSYIIASTRVPDVRIDQIPVDREGELTNELLDLLESYAEDLGA